MLSHGKHILLVSCCGENRALLQMLDSLAEPVYLLPFDVFQEASFRPRLDSNVLVYSNGNGGHLLFHEVYSIKKGQLQQHYIGLWNATTRSIIDWNLEDNSRRRNKLNGTSLKAGVMKYHPSLCKIPK